MKTRCLLLTLCSALGILHACDAGTEPTPQTSPPPANSTPISRTTPPGSATPIPPGEPVSKRVLFVGNSYTFYNAMPGVVRQLSAATPNTDLETASATRGGARLLEHWTSTGAREQIEAGGWDAVVVQGQSTEPVLAREGFLEYARHLSGAIEAAGAQGVWFATWARREGHPIYDSAVRDQATMTEGLERSYTEAAAFREGDVVARVGAAWQLALKELPNVDLYTADGSHPSKAGTMIVACVMFHALFERPPRLPDPPPLDLAADQATALCAFASRVQ